MEINSIFEHNGKIPKKYSHDGNNINPPFEFSNVPASTFSLALIMEDHDTTETFVHWLLWNIPFKIIQEDSIPMGAVQGLNGAKKLGYLGPCPPKGTHRYFFKLYALDIELNLKEGAEKEDLKKAMYKHILAKAELIGLYSNDKPYYQ